MGNGTRALSALLIIVIALLATGCMVEKGKVDQPPPPKAEVKRPEATFCLLPRKDGKVGKVVVSTPKGERTLSTAYESVSVKGGDSAPGEVRTMTGEEAQKTFGAAIDALPPPPAHFILYFEKDKPELTEASKPLIAEIEKAIRERRGADVSIVGHTDTTGEREKNFQLGLRRAKAMVELLAAKGLDLSAAQVASHGMDNLLVETGPGIDEPRNRRVEITVR